MLSQESVANKFLVGVKKNEILEVLDITNSSDLYSYDSEEDDYYDDIDITKDLVDYFLNLNRSGRRLLGAENVPFSLLPQVLCGANPEAIFLSSRETRTARPQV